MNVEEYDEAGDLQELRVEIQRLAQDEEGVITLAEAHSDGGWTALRIALAGWINELIQTNLQQLIQLLYRIDISEPKLKFLLKEKVGEDAAMIIADLIIERQLQKIRTRRKFQAPPADSDEELW